MNQGDFILVLACGLLVQSVTLLVHMKIVDARFELMEIKIERKLAQKVDR